MINSATKQSILSWRGPMDCFACARNDGVETRAPHLQPSSPGLTGRSSIPETAVMESQIPGLVRSLSSDALSCDPLVAIKIYRPCDFPEPIQQVCPTGKSVGFPKSCQANNFRISEISLANGPKSLLYPSLSRPTEGRFAIVTDVGQGMRWTRQRQAQRKRARR